MIRYKKDTNNIVTLTLDMAGRSMNVINHQLAEAFTPVMQHLKDKKNNGELRGIIITSEKKSFLSGGDLDYLFNLESAEECFRYSQSMQKIFRTFEHPGVPVVAAMNGSALGSGFELALACHYRIAIDHPRTKFGHPEVTLGIMPGSGGVIRLMWILGIEKAFGILSSGRQYSPQEAFQVGMIDELAKDQKSMVEKAKNWILKTTEGRRTWDTENGVIPEGTAKDPAVARTIQRLAATLFKETYHNYPAPLAILNTLAEGSKVDFDTAVTIQSRYFTELALSKKAKNMCKAFWYDLNAIKDGLTRPKGIGKFRPKKIGIIGAGVMGSGIAYTCLVYGLEVVLKDITKPVAERGKEYAAKKLKERFEHGKMTEDEMNDALGRITTTEKPSDFETCDLVIEAVFENQMVKAKVMREAEEFMDEYSIFASNTISIPITKLSNSSIRPKNFVGLHFFHPVEEAPLVEVVQGKQTSDETIARAFDFVKTIKRIPIVVKDNWGFYAARVQNTYILEGITLLQEGYSAALIENLSRQSGMKKSPLTMADEISLPIVLQYEKQAAEHYGEKYIQHPAAIALEIMIEEHSRNGAQKKAGFYEYDIDHNKKLWTKLDEVFPIQKNDYNVDLIIERLLFAQIIEAVWCLQEGIIASVAEGNVGSIFGWGFPSFKGGTFQYINDYGLGKFIDRCQELEKEHGPRFLVPGLLKEQFKKQLEFA